MKNRNSSRQINKLKANQVFVFGSSLMGNRVAGAALDAYKRFGAQKGVGEGMSGQTYGIPTKDLRLNVMPVRLIGSYVDKFIQYAIEHPEQDFLVTRIGCGLSGYRANHIAPLFKAAVDVANIYLPESFWRILNK